MSALKSASKSPSVKRFVYTSSSSAAIFAAPGLQFHCDENSWNTRAVKPAWAPPPYEASRGVMNYMASKVETEKALWKFVGEEQPGHVVSTVLWCTALGKILSQQQTGSSAGWVRQLYRGGCE